MNRRLLAMCGIVALAVLACGAWNPAVPTPVPSPTPVPLPPDAVVLRVDIKNFEVNLEIEVGTTIIWTNAETSGFHTITPTPRNSEESPGWVNTGPILPGDSVRHTFNKAGTFKYTCLIHIATKRGTVTVVEASGS